MAELGFEPLQAVFKAHAYVHYNITTSQHVYWFAIFLRRMTVATNQEFPPGFKLSAAEWEAGRRYIFGTVH